MTDAIRPLIAGNWKMNGLKASMAEFEAMLAGAPGVAGKADLLVCPPATLIAAFAGDRPILAPVCVSLPNMTQTRLYTRNRFAF